MEDKQNTGNEGGTEQHEYNNKDHEMGDGQENGENQSGAKKDSEDERKLFVGGISWETEHKDLKEYFSKFGEVTEVNIKTDPITGKCRGFGFITFGSKEAVDNVLNNQPHTVKGKKIDPKPAKARPSLKKIFVGGLDASLTEADIKSHFEQYGKIEQIEQPFDKTRNQKRLFCFITFETEEAVDAACKQAKQKVGSKECDVKKATINTGGRGGARGAAAAAGGRGRGAARGGATRGASNLGTYAAYYSQGYGGYGSGYGYGTYTGYEYPSYGAGYSTGYDYTGWGYGTGQGYGTGYSQQPSSYGKVAKRGGTATAGAAATTTTYHPYQR